MSVYQKFIKRVMDIIIALSIFSILFPILLVIYSLIRIKLGAPGLFTQQRSGYKGKTFVLYKFRTMHHFVDQQGNLLSDEQRLTSFGSLLRRWSLDELPSLLNVIRGEMSLVGPRPLLTEYEAYYTSEQKQRHNVKPGITGWAQVRGRNALSWNEKFKYDVWYVKNCSFLLDLKILLATFYVVFKKSGIHAEGYATMPKFTAPAFKETKGI